MSKRIARVFPRKTNMSPDDSLAFFGEPTIEAMAADIEEVHISVTFTWDLERAEALYESWQLLGVPVEVGGPAFDDRMGDFTPGMYLKRGMTVTSRGCSKDCWFCSVPRCARGVIRELPIQDGWNILDDNILGTSESHFRGGDRDAAAGAGAGGVQRRPGARAVAALAGGASAEHQPPDDVHGLRHKG
jgi:hypothetical protein